MAAFAAAVRERFPGCPPGEELRVARYACKRGTSRVGHMALSNGHAEGAVDLAVVAHLRHRFSDYERHLGQGRTREQARALVEAEVSKMLHLWETPIKPGQGGL